METEKENNLRASAMRAKAEFQLQHSVFYTKVGKKKESAHCSGCRTLGSFDERHLWTNETWVMAESLKEP
jgi:hypothetical protein